MIEVYPMLQRNWMAMAVAATAADGSITICGAEAVEKSAPAFWSEFASLGGSAQ